MRPLNVFVAPTGNAFMRDIAAWIVEAGTLLGHRSTLHDRGGCPHDADALNLVVAPHEFYLLGGFTDRQIDGAARISVPVCTEQPGTPWFDVSRLFCTASPTVLDINLHGVEALRRQGSDAHHLRLGGVPSMDRRVADASRRVELLFLGGRTDRRSRRLADLAPVLWDRRVELRLFSFDRPVLDGVDGLVFGRDKYDLLADSLVLLNLHRDDTTPGYFEWARMVEAMANGCCVVTEPSSGFEPLAAGVHFLEADRLVDTIPSLLDDPNRAAEIGGRAAEAVLEQYPLTTTLEPLLARIQELRPTKRRLIAPGYGARALRAQQVPVLPVFTPTAAIRQRIYRALTAETALQRQIERTRCRLRHGSDDHVEQVESTAYATTDGPEVSVVVTLYDYGRVVVETLDSIAASTDIEFEVIVVDDHSSDDGREVVAGWIADHPGVATLLLGSEINRGLPAARNLAIEAARAPKVMVMDADNLVYPSALRRLSDALDADPEAAFAYSTLEEFGTDRGVRSSMGWHVPWLCDANYIDAQAMVRRDAWRRHGGYRTDDDLVFGWEDWELWLRFAAAGEHGVHVPQMLGRYRTQEVSMLSTTNLVADLMLGHLRELYPHLPWGPIG